jgi:hypothetical protein
MLRNLLIFGVIPLLTMSDGVLQAAETPIAARDSRIAGTPTKVTPLAGSCAYSVSPDGQAFSEAGGTGTFNVYAGIFAWDVTNPVSWPENWITLTGATSGHGNGTVSFQVAGNTGAARTATLSVGCASFTVEQTAASTASLPVAGSLAHLASGGGWESLVTLVNMGSTSTTARLNLYGDAGGALNLPMRFPQLADNRTTMASSLDRSIPAHGLLMLHSRQDDAASAAQTGTAQLLAAGGLDGFAIFHYTPTGQQAVVPLETRNASSYLLAFDNTGSLTTGFAIANLASQAATVSAVIRDDTGAQIGTGEIQLAAQGHDSFMLTDAAKGFPVAAGKRGTVEFDTPSGGRISVIGLRVNNGKAITTLPLLADVATGGGALAHVAAGGGWQTTFTLVNTGSSSAEAQIRFLDENGVAMPLLVTYPQTERSETTSLVTQTLASGASLLLQAQGLGGQTASTGSAQLTSSGQVSGFAIFQYLATAQEAVVPLETRNNGGYVLAFDNSNGLATGVALASLAAQATSVPVLIRDDAGQVLRNDSLSLVANGHSSFMLASQWPETAGRWGTVEFGPGGGAIAVVGIRATAAGVITTIPSLGMPAGGSVGASAPEITSLSPSSATAGGPAFTLSVSGSKFVTGAVVKWGTSSLATAFVSASQLTAAVPSSLIQSAATPTISVVNPDGQVSSGIGFTILSWSSPNCVNLAGSWSASQSGAMTVTVTMDGQTQSESDSVSGSGTWVITQTDCSIQYGPFVNASRFTEAQKAALLATGTVTGNSFTAQSLLGLVDETAGEYGVSFDTVSQNTMATNGTLVEDHITATFQGSLAATGTISADGETHAFAMTMTGSGQIIAPRLGSGPNAANQGMPGPSLRNYTKSSTPGASRAGDRPGLNSSDDRISRRLLDVLVQAFTARRD